MQEDRHMMRFAKTWAVAAGAAAVLGGLGVGVASAASSSPAPKATVTSVAPSATSGSHEAEARGRVAEGETHARHTGVDDRTGATRTPEAGDDHGSGGHGADD
jgi:hypothetical protein